MTKDDTSFEDWMREVKRVAVAHYNFSEESAATIDEVAYKRDYYEEGYGPGEALHADLDEIVDFI